MAGRRRLAAFSLSLAHPRWRQLSFDGERWTLWPRLLSEPEQALSGVQVALEWPGMRLLRLRWSRSGWRRFWPGEAHVMLRRREHSTLWPLIGAALTQSQGREWLGRR